MIQQCLKFCKQLLEKLRATSQKAEDETQEIRNVLAPFIRVGMVFVLIILCFFGLWGSLAPLDSAAIAPGSIVVYSNRKTVQHLEGGIVRDLLVKEGDEVTLGQPLIYLNDTSARAKQDLLMGQFRLAKATEARLEAERDQLEEVLFPLVVLEAMKQKEVAKIVDSQKRLFSTRTSTLEGQVEVLQQQILQFENQIQGLKAQRVSANKQLSLINEEIAAKEKLLAQGLLEKPRLLALQREAANLIGQKGEYQSEIAKVFESITETKLEIINIQNQYAKEVMDELKEAQQEVADLQEQLLASKDVLERTVITAPLSGKVTGLNVHTIGGVIAAGADIMDIVPSDDRLVVDARVSPQDIDIVHEGLGAKVMLSAYKSRFVPRVAGKIIHVSADRFTDEHTQEPYYLAKVEVSTQAVKSLATEVTLYPGRDSLPSAVMPDTFLFLPAFPNAEGCAIAVCAAQQAQATLTNVPIRFLKYSIQHCDYALHGTSCCVYFEMAKALLWLA